MKPSNLFLTAAALVALPQPALCGDVPADRWSGRQPQGTFKSPKSSLSLEYCIATKIAAPLVIHGEGLTEIDSYLFQLGIRIAERGAEREVTFVANPRVNDHTAATIRGCI